ncbi:hypothetical protein Tco_1265596 [Tanacetum coccineum]
MDVLKLSPCYLAFLITAEVPKIYMHQFWNTIKKIKDTDAYPFKLDKKKFRIDTEVFREILHICPRLPNQDFVKPPSDEEMVPFIKELRYTGRCDMLSEIHTDQMHQPWRTFVAVINRCISRKSTGLDRLRTSRAQILWGMFYKENVDFVALLWEDFMFQEDNRDISPTRKGNMPYTRFTKVIINRFMSKEKTISIRNKINLHTIRDDSLLGTLKYVSKIDDYQKYGALIPEQKINQAIQDSKAYKTYLDFATRKATPKKARKFKKITSPLKKHTLEDVSSKKPSGKKSTGVQIKDTPDVSVSKMKASAKAERSKGIELLSDAALLEEAQLKKALKRSKRDTNIHQAGGSSEGADSESEVPNEPKGKSIDTSEGTGLKPGVPDVSIAESSKSENESWGDSGDEADEQNDEYIHTLENYVPTDDETNDETKEFDEEEYEELYGDVNISLTDAKPTNKEKGDVKMTNIETLDADLENVNQEEATTSTIVVPDFETLSAFHQRITNLEKDVKEIKTVDHFAALLSTIKSEVPNVVK